MFIGSLKRLLGRPANLEPASIEPIIPILRDYFSTQKISVVEIGARHGDSSLRLLTQLNIEKYYIVDPYECYDDYEGDGFNQALSSSMGAGDEIYSAIKNRLSSFPVEFIRKYSHDAAADIKDGSIDLLYIDGNHTYEYVKNDISLYMPKLVQGGIACGDDFFMRHDNKDHLRTLNGDYQERMVWEAVTEYCLQKGLDVYGYGQHLGYPQTWLTVKT